MIGEYIIGRWMRTSHKSEKKARISARVLVKSEFFEVERATQHLLTRFKEAN